MMSREVYFVLDSHILRGVCHYGCPALGERGTLPAGDDETADELAWRPSVQ